MNYQVEIVEQPMAKAQRFRYKCEGKSAGSLLGCHSTATNKTFPSIKVKDWNGPAIVVVSCVTKDEPYYPHPHWLVGSGCKDGVCTIEVKKCSGVIALTNVGIQCSKKQEVQSNLQLRRKMQIDPYMTDGQCKEPIDLGVVRLCFQVFLPDGNNKFSRPLKPIVTEPIIDKKSISDLVISRVSRKSGSCLGNDEIFILCEKVNKDDIQVRFYQESDDQFSWESYGVFESSDVHRQCAIVLKTPAFKDLCIKEPTEVYMQLCKRSDSSFGESIKFTYVPVSEIKQEMVDSTTISSTTFSCESNINKRNKMEQNENTANNIIASSLFSTDDPMHTYSFANIVGPSLANISMEKNINNSYDCAPTNYIIVDSNQLTDLQSLDILHQNGILVNVNGITKINQNNFTNDDNVKNYININDDNIITNVSNLSNDVIIQHVQTNNNNAITVNNLTSCINICDNNISQADSLVDNNDERNPVTPQIIFTINSDIGESFIHNNNSDKDESNESNKVLNDDDINYDNDNETPVKKMKMNSETAITTNIYHDISVGSTA